MHTFHSYQTCAATALLLSDTITTHINIHSYLDIKEQTYCTRVQQIKLAIMKRYYVNEIIMTCLSIASAYIGEFYCHSNLCDYLWSIELLWFRLVVRLML